MVVQSSLVLKVIHQLQIKLAVTGDITSAIRYAYHLWPQGSSASTACRITATQQTDISRVVVLATLPR